MTRRAHHATSPISTAGASSLKRTDSAPAYSHDKPSLAASHSPVRPLHVVIGNLRKPRTMIRRRSTRQSAVATDWKSPTFSIIRRANDVCDCVRSRSKPHGTASVVFIRQALLSLPLLVVGDSVAHTGVEWFWITTADRQSARSSVRFRGKCSQGMNPAPAVH